MANIGHELSEMFEEIEETILGSDREYMVMMAVEGVCSRLGIVTPDENNEYAVEEANAEFVASARAEYGEVVKKFEEIVRSFYETDDKLEFLKNLRKISFFR